ncbi:DUF6492 family protein [Vibrio splendidus]|uniref:DUF6492 family protein n=1 Tax=Vibrio splendidus TaxID=29497 RepID=UPI000C85C3B0|nr:DUF6492 family protein [Vibrio splendidus]PMH10122.1 hypothetical protein BCU75_10780 [Vibrio splendidus]
MSNIESIPCVIVAEASVLNTARLAVEGLLINSNVSRVDIVVPDHQYLMFYNMASDLNFENVNIIKETNIIPQPDIEKIKIGLAHKVNRFGWYLQQFLKWQYGLCISERSYLIWDADTVLIKPMEFDSDIYQFNMAKENHTPYFDTIKKLLSIDKQVDKSFISQYMLMKVSDLEVLIERVNEKDLGWYHTVISKLNLIDNSEFSEYETYGNYILSSKSNVNLNNDLWFRYGSEIININDKTSICKLEEVFPQYYYIAFERHDKRLSKTILAHALHKMGIILNFFNLGTKK